VKGEPYVVVCLLLVSAIRVSVTLLNVYPKDQG
jgi:hypothetical protein